MAANRFGEDYQQAMINSRRELDDYIPLIKPIKHPKSEQDRIELRKAKFHYKQDLAAICNMKFFKGNFPEIEKSYKQNFQKKLIRFEDLKHFNYNLN